MGQTIRIYPENPAERHINMAVDVLRKGGLIIFPTDTIYALGCDLHNPRALERMARLKGLKLEKANFSIIFDDLSMLSKYAKQIDSSAFRILKRCLPGPFTFILEAGREIPAIFMHNKKTVGIRIPDNNIPRALVRALGNPLAVTSIKDDDEIIEYTTDPELIAEKFEKLVDLVVHGGYGDNSASTVIDLSAGDPILVREGKGDITAVF
jgi:tRNA threonylcarbamoyl adenosine modification protein (Sua5/YciO/YrdC/YwlC family)